MKPLTTPYTFKGMLWGLKMVSRKVLGDGGDVKKKSVMDMEATSRLKIVNARPETSSKR
jgi:hypothetical protein